jgi:prepilin peptidase CpaA
MTNKGQRQRGLLNRQPAAVSDFFTDCPYASATRLTHPIRIGEIRMIIDIARLLLFPAIMAFAAASDLFTMTISNRVPLALVAGFLVLAPLSGMSGTDILMHLAAGASVLVAAFACFAMGWVGGGDAKLAAGAALWFGFAQLMNYLLYASLFGGALTILLLQLRQWPLPYVLTGQAWLIRLHAKESGIPYGIALAMGALAVYPQTEWMKAISLVPLAIH